MDQEQDCNLSRYGNIGFEYFVVELPAMHSCNLWGLALLVPFVAAGMAGVIVPVIPGPLVLFVGFLLYGWVTGFAHLSLGFFIGQFLIVLLCYAVDFLASAWGAKRFGGSKAAAWGAVLGSFLFFFVGPLGLLVGPVVGAVIGELIVGQELRNALRSGWGSLWGFLGGTVLKFILIMVMLAWFIWSIRTI